jgi:hypothetical protein
MHPAINNGLSHGGFDLTKGSRSGADLCADPVVMDIHPVGIPALAL